MTKFYLENGEELLAGLKEISKEFDYTVTDKSDADYIIKVSESDTDESTVKLEKNNIDIRYGGGKVKFYRAFGLALEAIADGKAEFSKSEYPVFKRCGAMFNVSGLDTLSTESLKYIFRKSAIMGIDFCSLYFENVYELEGMPYFGHMCGRYSKEEMKELSAYSDILGIELVPHIQTLGHMAAALKWNCMAKYREAEADLLVGSEDTYELIDKMLKTMAECFTSRNINLGMDESWMMGLGTSLKKNGYQDRWKMFLDHLTRVKDMAKGYGFKPSIYGDMVFRIANNFRGNYCKETSIVIPDYIKEQFPKDVVLNYWNYYSDDEKVYDIMLQKHQELCEDTVFTGETWTTLNGACPDLERSFRWSIPGLEACKKRNVQEVAAFSWGCYYDANMIFALPGIQVYAEYNYNGKHDYDTFAKRCEFCCDVKAADVIKCKEIDKPDGYFDSEASRFLLYNDPLLGLIDKHVQEMKTDISEYYKNLSKEFETVGPESGPFKLIFDRFRAMISLFENKADFGVRLRNAYLGGNKNDLTAFIDESKVIVSKLRILHKAHYKEWMSIYKPFGWEIMDVRYGTMITRFELLPMRLEEYISGEISSIPELEEERLWYDCRDDATSITPFGPMPRHFTRIFTVHNI